jgi:Domain of unknown function (DUF5615)
VKFKTDENLPGEAATVLQSAGFDAETVWSEALSGAPDEILADHARHEARVLVTLDLDFANIRNYPPKSMAASSCYVRVSKISRAYYLCYAGFFPSCWNEVRLANFGSYNVIVFALGKAEISGPKPTSGDESF